MNCTINFYSDFQNEINKLHIITADNEIQAVDIIISHIVKGYKIRSGWIVTSIFRNGINKRIQFKLNLQLITNYLTDLTEKDKNIYKYMFFQYMKKESVIHGKLAK